MRHFTLVESSRAFCSIPVFGQSKSSQDFEPAFCVKVLVRSECQAGVKLIRGLLGPVRRTAAYVHDPDSRTRFKGIVPKKHIELIPSAVENWNSCQFSLIPSQSTYSIGLFAGGQHAFIETGRRRVSGDFLAGLRRVWKCSTCCSFSPTGYRFLWRGPCLWVNCADDGLRHWAHFGLPFESSCVLRPGCRQAFSSFGIVAIYHRPVDRRDCRSRGTVRRRERKGRVRRDQRVRVERLRRTFTWWVFLDCMLRRRGGTDVLFPDDHHGIDGQACTSRVCADCDRAGFNLDSSHWNPGYESVGKSRSEYRHGDLCRKLGDGTTLAVLGRADYRRHRRRSFVRSNVRASCLTGKDSGY